MQMLGVDDPAHVGPFRTVGVLGQSGMGQVLLGVAPDGRPAAVKLVHARQAADDGFRSRFRREVEASRKVSGAYTAAVLDADADAELPWPASAFLPGPSLGAAVERAGALPEGALHRLAVGLATALDEIHRAASSTATSSPRTSCSQRTAPGSSTSASRGRRRRQRRRGMSPNSPAPAG
ncbi:hypothetical protein [Streptomyces roseoverticillatus]|uniref:hypothetical protein n=1 Tax=Streptomyces roseoverticillatus TaxID=66429 RepID=UPI0006947731|nr:hypothetical protein [Streptomyces roseoverticillatus]